jgi:hypothetical protein
VRLHRREEWRKCELLRGRREGKGGHPSHVTPWHMQPAHKRRLLDLSCLMAAEIQVEEEKLQGRRSGYFEVWETMKIKGRSSESAA